MIYPYPLFLHLVLALFCLLILSYLVIKRKSFDVKAMMNYFSWFLCYFLYSIFLSVPLFFFKELKFELSFFYNSALLFQGIGMWFIFRMALGFLGLSSKVAKLLSRTFFIGIILATGLHFIFPDTPRASEDNNWIFWYSNKPIGLFYSFFAFVAGYFWGFVLIKNISRLEKFILKVRALILAIPGFVLPFAAYFYFTPRSVLDIYLAFLFLIIGFLFIISGSIFIKIS